MFCEIVCIISSMLLNIIMTQWVNYWACELHIPSSNPIKAFELFIFAELNFKKNHIFLPNYLFFNYSISLLYFLCISTLFFIINSFSADLRNVLFQGIVSHFNANLRYHKLCLFSYLSHCLDLSLTFLLYLF